MKYAIGLDIGISSVGYSILELDSKDQPFRIEKLGSRIFDKAERPKDGASLAAPRREARSARRRLRRHRHRLERIRGLILSSNILTKKQLDELYDGRLSDIYELRTRALDELVSREEFARIMIHLAQRRGFKSNRKSGSGENGKLLIAVSENKERCIQNGYRTIGEMFYRDQAFSVYKRNKADDYKATVDRFSIKEEAHLIFEAQREYGAEYLTEDIEEKYLEILLSQRSFAEGPACGPYSGNQVDKMRGFCTLEPEENKEFRAAKASYSFQLFTLWQHINNIRIIEKDSVRELTDEERKTIFELAHEKKEISFAQIRKAIGLSDEQAFKGISHIIEKKDNPEEKTKLKDLSAYHQIKKCIESVSKEAFSLLTNDDLDVIGEALSKNLSDEQIRSALLDNGISEEIANIELPDFSKFGHISVKACKKLLPHLANGLTYDKACAEAGYNFKADDKMLSMTLPPLPADDREITSPVAKRSISQAIKVINAIIRKMGNSPTYINIELARELAKDSDERKKIQKGQEANAALNEKLMDSLLNEYGVSNPTGQDIIKLKLWQEQDGRCLYSGKAIEIERLSEPGYVDVDHIVPYSICFDDRMVNKALVLSKENREKGNRLPLQYLTGIKRDEFIVRINSMNIKRAKKERLLKEHITDEREWKLRNLQDTQFISSFLRKYIDCHLLFSPFDSNKERHVTAVNGAITAYVRKRWGIQKLREEGDLHHAVDAVVIGCITQGMINKISKHSLYKETMEIGEYTVDAETGEVIDKFPLPWAHFRDELDIRMIQNEKRLRELLFSVNYQSYLETDLSTIHPPFVSRMCNHKNTGAAHKETIRSGRIKEQGLVISKVALDSLTLDTDDEIKGYYNPGSDRLLYEALKERLLKFDGDGKKAFADKPFYKPKADGTNGPIVKKVKIFDTSSSLVEVLDHNGVAENDNIVRCDVFYVENDGYYFIPIYVADTVKDKLPQYAPVAGKDKNGIKKRKLMCDEDFVFSLYQNDLICIRPSKDITLETANKKSKLPSKLDIRQGDSLFLYYQGIDSSTAVLSGISHDNTYKYRSIGKTTLSIEKYEVDVLGDIRKVGKEIRRTYSARKK